MMSASGGIQEVESEKKCGIESFAASRYSFNVPNLPVLLRYCAYALDGLQGQSMCLSARNRTLFRQHPVISCHLVAAFRWRYIPDDTCSFH